MYPFLPFGGVQVGAAGDLFFRRVQVLGRVRKKKQKKSNAKQCTASRRELHFLLQSWRRGGPAEAEAVGLKAKRQFKNQVRNCITKGVKLCSELGRKNASTWIPNSAKNQVRNWSDTDSARTGSHGSWWLRTGQNVGHVQLRVQLRNMSNIERGDMNL